MFALESSSSSSSSSVLTRQALRKVETEDEDDDEDDFKRCTLESQGEWVVVRTTTEKGRGGRQENCQHTDVFAEDNLLAWTIGKIVIHENVEENWSCFRRRRYCRRTGIAHPLPV